ncbi:MAG: hypothetical protein ABSF34_16520 [Verrucomicrobiota bacterium]
MKNIQNFTFMDEAARICLASIGYVFTFAVVGTLLVLWICSEPFLRLGDDFSRGAKQKAGVPKLKRHAIISTSRSLACIHLTLD